jgi:site-specific DNA-methyltransferase (adenine-specific)
MESNVYNIDCMEYMRTLPDKAFSLAIVDPPYGLDRKSTQGSGKLKKRVLNTADIAKRWDVAPSKEYFDELRRVSENQIIWGGNYFDLPPCRCFVCWDKMQPWPNFSQAEFAWTSFDKPAKVFRHTSRIKGKWHPTSKPVELYAFLLRTFAKEGYRILDTHMGSQSSRIAAYKLGFDYVGCEIDKEYFDEGCEEFRKECQIQPQLL